MRPTLSMLVLPLTLVCCSTATQSATDAATLGDSAISPADARTDAATADVALDPNAPLTGTWRLVRYQQSGGDMPFDLTVHDTTVTFANGGTEVLRVNGTLVVTEDRFSTSFAELLAGHCYTDARAATGAEALSTLAFSQLGAPEDFTPVARNADGSITAADTGNHALYTLVRTASIDGPSTYASTGQTSYFGPTTRAPFTGDARFAIAWDLTGAGTVVTNDVTIAFAQPDHGQYTVAVSVPPSQAVASVGTARVAVGYPFAYDDTNRDGSYTAGTDVLRGASQIALVWRGGTADPSALAASAFADVGSGFTTALVYSVPGARRPLLAPLDPQSSVPLDVALDARAMSDVAFPDLVP